MHIKIDNIPERQIRPRNTGVTMVMDIGLSVREAEDLVETSGHLIDFIKLGFGTSIFTGRVAEKVKIFKDNGIKVYVGGTLLEAFVYRNQLDQYTSWIEKIGCDAVEISDGSMEMDHKLKCDLISTYAKDYTVLSEVGNKEAENILETEQWIEMMQKEITAGSFKVIAEARESGTVGIYDNSGKADTSLIDNLINHIDPNMIMWEAPEKSQQAWFIKKLGHNVNLGNIDPREIIPLETLRAGLRGDTFLQFVD